jgi:CheY-like chemotaxis protein
MPASKGRVFVVEDHAMTARGVKSYLELCGYEVDLASTIAAALKHAEKNSFDVMLCDINLPDGTGWELLSKLRKTKAVSAIAYSAYNEPEQVSRSKAAGFIDHVVKGATPEDLVSAIERAMPGKRA